MNIITPYAKILDVPHREAGILLLQKVEWCGRISHRSEDKQTDTSWERFIRGVVLTHGDWSIAEHANVTADIVVDRGVTHEIVRHRIGAYTMESTRFVSYKTKRPAQFIIPENLSEQQEMQWHVAVGQCEAMYQNLLSDGVSPQIARSVLPNALAARLVVTYNLRNWRHFFLMRTSLESHPQMRQVTIPLLLEFQEKIPLLYDDIAPETKQSENLKKAR